jgi:DNA-binding transcriptional ArsR family regulator
MLQSRLQLFVACVLCLVVVTSLSVTAIGPDSPAPVDPSVNRLDDVDRRPGVDPGHGLVAPDGSPYHEPLATGAAVELSSSTPNRDGVVGLEPTGSLPSFPPTVGQSVTTGAATVSTPPIAGTATTPFVGGIELVHQQGIDEAISRLTLPIDADDNPIGPPGLVALVGYSRHDSDPLDHAVRSRIYETIQASPGIYPAALADQLDTPRSTLRYHLRILETDSLVTTREIDGKRRYVATEATAAERALAVVDEGTTAASIVEALAREGPATVSELAAGVDRSPGTVSYHLDRLEDAAVVERERDGQAVQNRLATEVSPLIASVSASTATSGSSDPFDAAADD